MYKSASEQQNIDNGAIDKARPGKINVYRTISSNKDDLTSSAVTRNNLRQKVTQVSREDGGHHQAAPETSHSSIDNVKIYSPTVEGDEQAHFSHEGLKRPTTSMPVAQSGQMPSHRNLFVQSPLDPYIQSQM